MNDILVSAILGFGGALLRVLIFSGRTLSGYGVLSRSAFLLYSVVVLACGIFSGIVLGSSLPLAFLSGYACLDLMDSYYSAFKKRKVTFG